MTKPLITEITALFMMNNRLFALEAIFVAYLYPSNFVRLKKVTLWNREVVNCNPLITAHSDGRCGVMDKENIILHIISYYAVPPN